MVGKQLQRYRKKSMADINVVPYIDVMLVLLVVFMVTAPLLTQGIHVELPKVNGEPTQQDPDPIVISIDKAGQYYLNISADSKKPMALIQIQDSVNKVLNTRPNLPVLIEGDASVAYGAVVHLMSALQRAGTPNLGLITEPNGDKVSSSEPSNQ